MSVWRVMVSAFREAFRENRLEGRSDNSRNEQRLCWLSSRLRQVKTPAGFKETKTLMIEQKVNAVKNCKTIEIMRTER